MGERPQAGLGAVRWLGAVRLGLGALLASAAFAGCGGEPQVAEPMLFVWGETLERSADSLPPNSHVEMTIQLPIPMDDDAPLNVRLVNPEREARILEAEFTSDSLDRVHLEVETEWLIPGRHLIEVSTRERTPLPLRRYALEIE